MYYSFSNFQDVWSCQELDPLQRQAEKSSRWKGGVDQQKKQVAVKLMWMDVLSDGPVSRLDAGSVAFCKSTVSG